MSSTARQVRFSALAGAVCAVVLTLSLPTGAHAAPAPAQASSPTADDHPATLAALKTFQSHAGPGAAVRAGDSAGSWDLSVGTGTINTSRPIQPGEHYRVGSQSKVFTAVAVLQLVDEGEVALDTPIERYLPGVVAGNGHNGSVVTVRQLLQHTSGIPVNNAPAPRADPDGTYSLAALVEDGLRRPSASVPGTKFEYSNTNYEILGMLLEKVTGLRAHEVITRRVIEPLGLTQTRFPAPGDRSLPTPAVRGYHGIRVGSFFFWTDVLPFEPSSFSTAGAVISTQRDLAAFYRALLGGRLMSPASLAEMKRAVDVGDPASGWGYGLGLIRQPLPCGGVAWGHNGMLPGYYTQTLVTEDGRHAAVVTNAHLTTNIPAAQMEQLLNSALCEGK
ncbi:beta-lactamase family protein [Streptomyces sp. BR123]|uniref:serine hydrolase domain-containing protein n=1 Tax=Streptomyces sp. BR123 TaxID=2749828 RepID=UPI0015C4A12A|nr:serine hydrolase domain-containing protein [Streptomyces sp. BR123]NXY97543.1 beta-lactamase family protein [Streptomyces sp. BR123]